MKMKEPLRTLGFLGMAALCTAVVAVSGWWAAERMENSRAVSAQAVDSENETEEETEMLPVSGEKRYAAGEFRWNEALSCWVTEEMSCFQTEAGADVFAVEAGVIESLTFSSAQGMTVTILHDDGGKSVYQGLRRSSALKTGKRIEQGTKLGNTRNHQMKFAFFPPNPLE